MPGNYQDLRDAMRDLCNQYPDEYWRKIDEARGYPEAFVDALTKAGWMATLIPEQFGGSGLGLAEASVVMEEINRNGGNAGACHGQMYNMNTLLRHGSDAQKKHYLPKIASGELRLQSMGVTEPSPAPTPPNSKPPPNARATATSSTARRYGSQGFSIRT